MSTHPADVLVALRFFSRLPVPTTRREMQLGASGLAQAAALVPVAGAIIGLVPAAALALARWAALPATLSGALAVSALVVATGALHEDALADCADGFGGGGTRERKLAIMRDSRIGAYGACALMLSILVRAAALGAAAERSWVAGTGVAIAAAALSRTASLAPLVLLPPARTDGTAATVTRPSRGAFASAVALAVLVAGLALAPIWLPLGTVAAILLAALASLGTCALAKRQIGGHTGDVAGTAQQLAEIAVYLVFAAG